MTHPAPSGAEAGRIATCRICHGERLTPVLDLGEQASADNFPPADDPGPDARWPLALVICDDCSLVQLANRSPDEEEPRAVESATSRTHASAVASRVATAAALSDAADILECSSAHGGSWAEALRALGHQVTTDALDGVQTYDLVIDNHSMIHDEDTDGAFATRAAHVAAEEVRIHLPAGGEDGADRPLAEVEIGHADGADAAGESGSPGELGHTVAFHPDVGAGDDAGMIGEKRRVELVSRSVHDGSPAALGRGEGADRVEIGHEGFRRWVEGPGGSRVGTCVPDQAAALFRTVRRAP